MKTVLFICTHNSARSQMAEGLLRAFHGAVYEAWSAGTVATSVSPVAVAVMGELGIDLSGHRSKTWKSLGSKRFDYVVTVCNSAREECPYFPAVEKNIHRSFDDPSEVNDSEEARFEAFRIIRDEIRGWLDEEFGRAEIG